MQAKQAHPEIEQLSAFVLGKLGAADFDAVEQHLAACPACCDPLNLIKEDTFVGLVRAAKGENGARDNAVQSGQSMAEAATQGLASPPPAGPPTEPAASSPADVPAE